MLKNALLALLLVFIVNYYSPNFFPSLSCPIALTADGEVQGRVGFSRDGRKFLEYLSIPFAEPPIDKLRFEAPVPPRQPWSGVKQVVSYPPFCLQMDVALRAKLLGQEDCLYLNVFTHSLQGKRPVLVWIHGGGYFSGGSRLFHPEFYMDEDIVLVTINYRLGPLGFMNLEDDGNIKGNMGLKDQNLALKWVQKNIENFGGDPNQVTLFGESAGAGSVQYHLISQASKNLFHRAILQSGAVTMPTGFSNYPKRIARHYIEKTECAGKVDNELVNCLKKMDATQLVKLQIELMIPTSESLAFLPSTETRVTKDTFLSESPRKTLNSAELANNVPVMFGVTSGEGALRTASIEKYPEYIPELDKRWEETIGNVLVFESKPGISPDIARQIKQHYFGSNIIGSFTKNLHQFKRNFSALASHAVFLEPIQRAALLHAKKHNATTYMFYYDYETKLLPSIYSILRAVRHDDWLLANVKIAYASLVDLGKKWLGIEGPHEFGIPHSGGLLMQWNMEGWTGILAGPDTHFSKSLIKAFVDFAQNKKPLKFNGVSWPPIKNTSGKTFTYMVMSNTHTIVRRDSISERTLIWETLEHIRRSATNEY